MNLLSSNEICKKNGLFDGICKSESFAGALGRLLKKNKWVLRLQRAFTMVIPDKGNICNFSQHRLVYCGKIVEWPQLDIVGWPPRQTQSSTHPPG